MGVAMSQDKYIKFLLTIIAFSLFCIVINLAALEFFLYEMYTEKMESFFFTISSGADEFSSRVDKFTRQMDQISSSINDIVDAIKKR